MHYQGSPAPRPASLALTRRRLSTAGRAGMASPLPSRAWLAGAPRARAVQAPERDAAYPPSAQRGRAA